MPGLKRRVVRMEKRLVRPQGSDKPRWLVMHLSYSDGGEVYEVYPLEGAPSYRRFASESEMDAWLRKQRNATVS